MAAAGLATLSGCYTLTKDDIFEVAFDPIAPSVLAALSDDLHVLQPLMLEVAGRSISAYWDQSHISLGILIFFSGNGYGAETAARRMLIPTRALHLDLVVFNYVDRGQTIPTMMQMREISRALCEKAAQLPTPAARSIYVGGHSLGATFALDAGANDSLAGVFVAAPLTTGIAMLHHQLPYTRIARLNPDDDYRQLDNLALAARVRSKTLVVGSDGDSILPPTFTHAVFQALPDGIAKREVILHGVGHSGYLAAHEFWRGLRDFFDFPVDAEVVGYMSQ